MKYSEFKNKVQNWPIIRSRDLTLHRANKQTIRNQLERWSRKKLVTKLKRGVFILNPSDRKIAPSRGYVANQLYTPSYVSLEYALGFYGLIPERVRDLTSVTTRKTMRIRNELGVFIYQHVKPKAFRGFRELKDESGLGFFIAEPEKALVDFIYLNLDKFKGDHRSILETSFRLQNTEELSTKKIIGFTRLFNSKKLARVSRAFCDVVKEERKRK
jgi:predicted transcriptional regulator of viral defense system